MAEGKAGLAGGVVVALGIGLARFGDNCASAGVRGARLVDDAAVGGVAARRMAWGADDPARLGGRLADDAVPVGRRVAVDGTGLPGEGEWAKTLLDSGLDVGLELIDADFEEVPDTVVTTGRVKCPSVRSVIDDAKEWESLLAGLGVACAPVVVVGTAGEDGRSLGMGSTYTPLTELAQQCGSVGARCVFVGCPELTAPLCLQQTRSALLSNGLQPSLSSYVRRFVRRTIEQTAPPAFLAQLVPGDEGLALAVARPERGEPSERERMRKRPGAAPR